MIDAPFCLKPGAFLRHLAASARVAAALGALWLAPRVVTAGPLHVPSPDWRDQVIYFVMTDRFDDGDPRNNDQGAGEFDRRRETHFQGGDLAGLRRRLDYIQGLGATALWITPPVANQWLDRTGGTAGYHGYWAEHFGRVDRHLGTKADLRALSRDLHGRGMYLVQDIVLNHTGDFFDYRGGWDPDDPTRFYVPNSASRPVRRPSQTPFHLNDPRRAADRRAGIYHWTPTVRDYNDPVQEARFQMSGLDDLATGNPAVRRALRRAYGDWIREVGVDAFRLDTIFYVPPDDVADFLRARDPGAPGVLEVARRTGRQDFLVFGEGFGIDKPFDDSQARKLERYLQDPQGRPLMPAMLNFPLHGSLVDVLARGAPTAQLAWRIEQQMRLHQRPHLLPSFLDNHDLDRFRAGASEAALRQGLAALFTLPGIPVIYYGTEQGFIVQRASMFAAGHGSGGRDHFDTTSPLYRLIASLSRLRRGDTVFSRGTPRILAQNSAGPGVIAWRLDAPGRPPAIVVLNTADEPALLDKLSPDLPAGTRLAGRWSAEGEAPSVAVPADGRLTLALPARAAWVWQVDAAAASRASAGAAPALAFEPVPDVVTDDLVVSGRASAPGPVQLVLDGRLAAAPTAVPDAQGQWTARVSTADLVDPALRHSLVAWQPASGAVSATAGFRVERQWQTAAELEDPAGDDHGPQGRYRYPTDASYAAQRSMDLRRVRVRTSGGALQLDLEMAGLVRSWNPPHGFDHLALTVFVELPGRAEPGARVMPQQHGDLPGDLRWHRRVRVNGWTLATFESSGAGAAREGTPVSPGARLAVDHQARTVRLTLPAAALGGLPSLSGARIYVNTWDYDAGYRALSASPEPFAVGGGDPATGVRVMDDSPVIVLP